MTNEEIDYFLDEFFTGEQSTITDDEIRRFYEEITPKQSYKIDLVKLCGVLVAIGNVILVGKKLVDTFK